MNHINIIYYNFINSFKNIIRNRFLNFSILISLCLGLIFPIMVISMGNTVIKEYEGYTKDSNRGFLLSVGIRKLNIKNTIKEYPSIEAIAAETTANCLVIANNNFIYSYVSGVSINLNEFFDNIVKKGDGRYFTSDDYIKSSKVCILGKNVSKSIGGKTTSVIINGDEFQVIGTTNLSHFADITLIPDSTYYKKNSNNNILPLYLVKIKKGFPFESTMKILSKQIINEQSGNGHCQSMSDYLKNQQKTVHQGFLILFLVSLIAFIYSLVNLSSVIMNKFDFDTKNHLIKVAVGAFRKDLYIQMIFELLIITSLSVLINLLFIYSISKFGIQISNFSIEIDYQVIVYSFVAAFMGTFILGLTLIKRVTNLNLQKSISER